MNSSPFAQRDKCESTLLAVALLAYSNGIALYAHRSGEYPNSIFRRLNLYVLAALMAHAGSGRGGLAAVGLRREGFGRSLVGGAVLGFSLSAPPLFFLYKPILLDTPLEYGPISKLTRRELAGELFLRLPLHVALLEEVAFRGLLYRALRRQMSPERAIGLSATAFALWHFAVTAASAAQTNLDSAARLPLPLRSHVQLIAVLGGMLSTGLAGVGFALLRERSGNLAGPVLAHWLVDGAVVAALWGRSHTSDEREDDRAD